MIGWTRPLRLGFSLTVARVRGRSFVLLALVVVALGAVAGVLERHHAPAGAADRALASMMRLVLPLATLALLSLATGPRSLEQGVWCYARFGHSRRALALGVVAATALAAAFVSLLGVEVALAACYAGRAGQAWASDALTSGWITCLGAASYAAWFALGASWWRFGRARWVAFALDAVLGGGTGALAVLLPRAHVRSLVGGAPVLELSQRQSSVVLLALALGVSLVLALRMRD